MQPEPAQTSSPGLDESVFMHIIDNGNTEQRISLALQLAAFHCNEEAPHAERELVVPAVLKLTADPVFEVRAALAEGLSAHAGLNPDLLFSIIADDEEIALPFLLNTPALDHWQMLAVLRVGDAERQACVAARPDITPAAVEYIVESLPLAINMLLFENASVAFTAGQYRRLYARFGETEEMLECLLRQPHLPPDVRITQARRAASRLQSLVLERGWIPANDTAEILADAEENAVLQVLTTAEGEDLTAAVSFLVDGGMMTPALIVRAACLGALDVVSEALANLAGISVRRARKMMFGKPQGGFRSLHSKAGLPESCFWTLRAACDVAREEREDAVLLSADDFGRRMIEVLMTRYEALPLKERPKQLDFVGRFAADRVRLIARRLKADLLRAA